MKTGLRKDIDSGKMQSADQPTHTPTPWKVSQSPTLIKYQTQGNLGNGTILASAFLHDGTPYYEDAYIGVIQNKDNAAFTVRAVNSHSALLEAVKCADGIQRALDQNANRSHGAECVYCFAIARAEKGE